MHLKLVVNHEEIRIVMSIIGKISNEYTRKMDPCELCGRRTMWCFQIFAVRFMENAHN